jgi:hypothetical protein
MMRSMTVRLITQKVITMGLRYSIGDLIDRLVITLLKHWHLEEEISKYTNRVNTLGIENLSKEEIASAAEMYASSVKLNQYRNRIIEEINAFFSDNDLREDRSK